MTSIGAKLLRQVVVGIVAVMGVFGVLSVLREEAEESRTLGRKEERVLQQLDIGLENALWNLNRPQLDKILRSYLLDPDILSIRVLESENVMTHLARVPGTDQVAEIGADQVYAAPPGSHPRAIEIRRDEEVLGKVEVVFSAHRVGERLRASIVTTTLALLVLIAVVSALRKGGVAIGPQAVAEGLASVRWPGRLEVLRERPRLLLDGAHNPAAARVLAAFLAEEKRRLGGGITVIFGIMRDKPVAEVIAALRPVVDRWIATAPAMPRALPAGNVAAAIEEAGGTVTIAADPARAVAETLPILSPRDLCCVTGSFYTVAAAREPFLCPPPS